MYHLLSVICLFLWTLLNNLCNGVAEGIEHRNAKQALSNVFLILLFVAASVLVGLMLFSLAVRFWWALLIAWLLGSLIIVWHTRMALRTAATPALMTRWRLNWLLCAAGNTTSQCGS